MCELAYAPTVCLVACKENRSVRTEALVLSVL